MIQQVVSESVGCLHLCSLRSASFSCAVCREDGDRGFFATLEQVTSFIAVEFQLPQNTFSFPLAKTLFLLSKSAFAGERACELEARDVW